MSLLRALLVIPALLGSRPATPIATLRELGPALTACFRAPVRSAGSEITVVLSLTRQGSVFGKPKITYAKLVGQPEDRRAFVEAALGALAACTPVPLTPGLGGAVAGRPLSIRFVGGGPAQEI